jgi:hypothetical protein
LRKDIKGKWHKVHGFRHVALSVNKEL